ncbi:MAG: hypothetical protein NVS2B16_35020 [Chloroflexota bacterium]
MTAWLIGAITLILVVLIVGRRSSREFKRKTEEPKFQFLANVGVTSEEIEELQRAEEQKETQR